METSNELNISEIERLIGRELSKSEAGTIIWLSGWEMETRTNIMQLIKDAYINGLNK